MKLLEFIKEAQKIYDENGDLDILDSELYGIMGLTLETSEGDYPDDYDLPEGTKFVTIRSMN